jgi:hypothetical protein
MLNQDLSDAYIKRDAWVKALKKAYTPEDIAELLVKRINNSNVHGPYVRKHQDEQPTDIINAFIEKKEGFRKKIAPAVGLLLYNLLCERIAISHELLRGTFAIIKNSKLDECSALLWKWLKKNEATLVCDDTKWKSTYRDALYAFAYVQRLQDVELEKWWFSIWKTKSPFWWGASFIGLRIQNPMLASTQLENLIRTRYQEKTPHILAGMWSDERSRASLETALCAGLNENSGWAGMALNQLWKNLGVEERDKMMASLQNKVYCA